MVCCLSVGEVNALDDFRRGRMTLDMYFELVVRGGH